MSAVNGATTTALAFAVLFSLAVLWGDARRHRPYAVVAVAWVVAWAVLTVLSVFIGGSEPAPAPPVTA